MIGHFDTYQLRARVHPVLLAALPAAIDGYAFGASFQWFTRIMSVMVIFGVASLLVSAARDRGARLEPELWDSWGGPPTTTLMLSTSDAPSPELDDHRAHVHRLRPDLPEISDVTDQQDPVRARKTIESYVRHLRERTRDHSAFPIVFDANIAYGFRRNILGLRPIGLTIAVVSVIVSATVALFAAMGVIDLPGVPLLGAVGINCVATGLWWTASPSWVKVQADRYACALLAAAEGLEAQAGRR